jgi:hypothetical protein
MRATLVDSYSTELTSTQGFDLLKFAGAMSINLRGFLAHNFFSIEGNTAKRLNENATFIHHSSK